MAAHKEYAQKWWHQIAEYMLDWMAIDRCHRYGGGPFVMLLMYELIDVLVMQQAMRVIESQLLHQYADS